MIPILIFMAVLMTLVMPMLVKPDYIPRVKPGVLRAQDRAYRKDKREREMANQKHYLHRYARIFNFYIRRWIGAQYKKIEMWVKTPLKLKSLWYKLHIKAYYNPGIVTAIIIVLIIFDAILLYRLLPISILVSIGFVPIILVGITPYELENTGIVKVEDFCQESGARTQAEIQAAVNYAYTNNRAVIYFGPYTYNISGTTDAITIPQGIDGMYLIGCGATHTILNSTLTNGADIIKFDYTTEVTTDVVISDMFIQGGGNEGYGINLYYTQRILVERMRIDDCGNVTDSDSGGVCLDHVYFGQLMEVFCKGNNYFGIRFRYANTVAVINCRSSDTHRDIGTNFTGNGMQIADSVEVWIWGGSYENNDWAGIFYSRSASRCQAFNVYLEGNDGFGIQMYSTAEDPEDNKINNCYFNGIKGVPNTATGIGIEDGSRHEVSSCVFRNHTQQSIMVSDNNRYTYKCLFYNNYTEDAQFIDIDGANATNIIIRDKDYINIIEDSGTYTIWPDMEYEEYINNSGGAVTIGQVVVFESSQIDSITTTDIEDSQNIAGVVYEATVSNGSLALIVTRGPLHASVLKVNGTIDIAIGDSLKTYPSAGISMKGTVISNCFAIALEAYTTDDSNGVIKAILTGDVRSGAGAKSFSTPFVYALGGATEDSTGVSCNAATEGSTAFFAIPDGVQKIVSMTIFARSNATEADRMMATINVRAGADNEPYNTHDSTNADIASTSINFASDDIIKWELSDAQISAIKSGDSGYCYVVYAAASGNNCATNCRFQSVLIKYL